MRNASMTNPINFLRQRLGRRRSSAAQSHLLELTATLEGGEAAERAGILRNPTFDTRPHHLSEANTAIGKSRRRSLPSHSRPGLAPSSQLNWLHYFLHLFLPVAASPSKPKIPA